MCRTMCGNGSNRLVKPASEDSVASVPYKNDSKQELG